MGKHSGPFKMQCGDCGSVRENVWHPRSVYCKDCLGHNMVVLASENAPLDTPEAPHNIDDTPVPQIKDVHKF